MKFELKPGQRMRMRNRAVLISTAAAGISLVVFLMFFGYFNTGVKQEAKATTTETIPAGSFLVNMGITPQTPANGLLPYGMIYELTNIYNVPIKWIIEPSKVKDGIDFWHNGISYKGGCFIIPSTFINPTITSRINYWKSLGVQGNYSVSSMNLPVYSEITSFPLVIIDTLSLNDSIIENYYENAGIPSTAFTKGSPDQVNSCHDMWINPHGDPTWTTHNYLYDFVTVEKSFIWMQCHAVSMMESCKNSSAPFEQLNYLSNDGLQCYMAAKCQGTAEVHTKNLPGSYAYFYPADPVMQFVGTIPNACSSGSERWFIPKLTGGWRSTTKRLVTTGLTTSPREGVVLTYGPAFGDTTNGLVMYIGGHDLNATTSSDRVAAQRTFFNFLLLAGKSKAVVLDEAMPGVMNANATDTFSVNVSGGAAPYTYSWTSSAGGTFATPNDSTTTFSAPHTVTPMQTIITCVVTDNCGRRSFFSNVLNINASALPISLIGFTAKPHLQNQVQLNWATGAEKNNNYFTIEKSADGQNFSFMKSVPSKGNSTSAQNYVLIDENPWNHVTWYRLSQTDFDGTRVNLKTVKAELTKKIQTATLRAYPNPFTNEIAIGGDWQAEQTVIARIFSTNGKMVLEKSFSTDDNGQSLQLDGLDHLAPGHYILKVNSGTDQSETIKILKK